jgi:Transcriptional regulator LmrA/YxaF-like, C-terminal domain
LLVRALERRREHRQARLEDALRSRPDDWREAVLAVFDWIADWIAERDFHGCAFVQATVEVGEGAPKVRALARSHKREFARALREHLERAGVSDAAELAVQLQLLVEGATTLAHVEGAADQALAARRAAATLLGRVRARS